LVHITALAPVRICDCGGWTDTWFARHGRVCQIAVWPGIEVDLVAQPWRSGEPRVRIAVGDGPFDERLHIGRPWGRHRLVEAAVAQLPPPADVAVRLTIASDMPAGASTGTSAAAAVAVIAAMDALHGGARTRGDIAALAHGAEVVQLGQQSGIQDQMAAAFGGINEIAIDRYPDARVIPIAVDDALSKALEERLLVVYFGRAHDSSAVHQAVIDRLTAHGADVEEPALEQLREAARSAAAALRAGDLAALGRAMRDNTAAQRMLSPALIGADAEQAIAIAESSRAPGWKVNGAGGEGGSLTVLCTDGRARAALEARLNAAGRQWRVIPVRVAWSGVDVRRV
jgi:D-glycero-alpha-D-manno-heptose-7-phosphate kinase